MQSLVLPATINSWFIGCICAAIVVSLVAFLTTGETAYGSTLTVYSLILLALLPVLVVYFSRILSGSSDFGSVLSSFVTQAGPLVLLLGIIAYALFLLIQYKSAIIHGHVAANFSIYSSVLYWLMIAQLFVYWYRGGGSMAGMSSSTTGIMYLFNVLCIIVEYVMRVILMYYRTDG